MMPQVLCMHSNDRRSDTIVESDDKREDSMREQKKTPYQPTLEIGAMLYNYITSPKKVLKYKNIPTSSDRRSKTLKLLF